MNELTTKPSKLLENAVLCYYVLMTIAAGIVCILALHLQIRWLCWSTIVFAVLHIEWGIINYKAPYLNKSFTVFYYIFVVTYSFPVVLVLWQIHVYTIILLYVLLPLLVMYHYYITKYTLCAACFSVFLIVLTIIISKITKLAQIDGSELYSVHITNIAITFIAMIFIIVFIYFYNKDSKFRVMEHFNVVEENNMQKVNTPQLKELYNNVIAYFDKKQPYRKSNYRLSMLAEDLNTNIKYLSEAINTNYGGTFESLLNKYRLNYAKKMLDERLADKYTIEYIYTSAGYSNRSTFYENFRKTFQMTPLEYQDMQPLKNIDK